MADKPEWKREDDGEEEDEEIDETDYKTVKDAVLFAIDVSSSMLRQTPPSQDSKSDPDSATRAALKCAYQLMQQRIISNPNDLMGVLLYGTQQSKFDESDGESTPYPHCYLLTDLGIPCADDVKRLRSLVQDEDEFKKLMVPASEPTAMANVLFCANQIFSTKAPNFSSRRLFLVTDNDDPHQKAKDLNNSAIVRAKDLFDLGVTIELFPISQPDQEFNTSTFYDDIVYNQSTDPEAPAGIVKAPKPSTANDGISLLSSLLLSIYSKIVPKRTLFSNLTLELAPKLKISVKGYVVFKKQEAQKSGYVYLDGETPVLATGKTTQLTQGSASTQPRQQPDVRRAYKFGGEFVPFKPDEIKELLDFGEPVIRLIGFKDRGLLPVWASLRPSTFIYPSDEDYIGSTRTFAALQETLLQKNKFGLVWYIARRNAAPVLAALLPGAEQLGAHGEQVVPAGLWLAQLPYADDIRQDPETSAPVTAPDDLKDKMRKVVQQLQLPGAHYDPLRYPNPALQWHYRILQALALEEDVPDKPDDKTVPRYRQIDKRAGQYVIDWGNALQDSFREWQASNADRRRPPTTTTTNTAAKKPKPAAAAEEDAMTDAQMRTHVDRDGVGRLTLPTLKAWLGARGLSLKGNKAALVERVEAHFEGRMRLD